MADSLNRLNKDFIFINYAYVICAKILDQSIPRNNMVDIKNSENEPRTNRAEMIFGCVPIPNLTR